MKRPSHSVHPEEESVLGKAYDAHLIRRLWRFVQPYRALVLLSFLLLLTVAAAQLVQPYLVKRAIDIYILERNPAGLLPLAAGFLAALVGESLLRFAQFYVLERTGQNVVFDLRAHIFAHLQGLPSAFFDRRPVGRLMTRVNKTVAGRNTRSGKASE